MAVFFQCPIKMVLPWLPHWYGERGRGVAISWLWCRATIVWGLRNPMTPDIED